MITFINYSIIFKCVNNFNFVWKYLRRLHSILKFLFLKKTEHTENYSRSQSLVAVLDIQ